jgi:hypothetical protein
MTYHKVSCLQCTVYEKCPAKTRIFVNYCGCAARNTNKASITSAIQECRTRRGLLFKQEQLPTIPIATLRGAMAVA